MASLIERHLSLDRIDLQLDATDRDGILQRLVDLLTASAGLTPRQAERVLAAVAEREAQANCALGRGVALPHARCPILPDYYIAAGRSAGGAAGYPSRDGEPVRLFFLLAGPPDKNGVHLQVMARLMRLCREADLRRRLLEAPTPEAFRDVLIGAEQTAGARP